MGVFRAAARQPQQDVYKRQAQAKYCKSLTNRMVGILHKFIGRVFDVQLGCSACLGTLFQAFQLTLLPHIAAHGLSLIHIFYTGRVNTEVVNLLLENARFAVLPA